MSHSVVLLSWENRKVTATNAITSQTRMLVVSRLSGRIDLGPLEHGKIHGSF